MTFLSLVQMLYHWVAGDSYELRPLNYVHVIFSCNNFLFKRDMEIVEKLDHCFGKGFIRGSKNTWIPYSLSSGQAALTFCLLRTTWLLTFLLMILLDSCPLGKWASKGTRSARKSTCPRLTDGIFFRPCYYAKLMLSRLLQISIYRLDDETNTVSQEIDLAILKALLKGMFSWVVPYFVWLHVLERELILYPVGFFADACEVLFLERRLEKEVRSRQRDSKTG